MLRLWELEYHKENLAVFPNRFSASKFKNLFMT